MNPKMEKVLESFLEQFSELVNKIQHEYGYFDNLEDKLYYLISNKMDFTFLQIKEDRNTCNMKELKKTSNLIKEALHNEKTLERCIELLNLFDLNSYIKRRDQEYENYNQQNLSSHFCLIAQNLHTKEYARIVFEEADEHFKDGYSLDFTNHRSQATEITKISESDKSIDYIQKLLSIDFPEISWKVFKSARIKGRDLSSYPVY